MDSPHPQLGNTVMFWRRAKLEPRFKLSASDLARELALMGARQRRVELRRRMLLTAERMRRDTAAGITAPIAPSEGWR